MSIPCLSAKMYHIQKSMFAHPPSWWPGQWNKAQATSFFNIFRGWDKTSKSRRSSQFLLLRLSSSSTSQWCVWPNHYHHPPHHWPSSSQLSIYDLKSHMSSAWPASLLCFLMNQSMFVALNRNRVSPFLPSPAFKWSLHIPTMNTWDGRAGLVISGVVLI